VLHQVPSITTVQGLEAAVQGIEAVREGNIASARCRIGPSRSSRPADTDDQVDHRREMAMITSDELLVRLLLTGYRSLARQFCSRWLTAIPRRSISMSSRC
jgi:hypothetical protein